MSRVAQLLSSTNAGPPSPTPGASTTSRTRTHKVVVENVTQEKKKLLSVLTFTTTPPNGYLFIPAGNPELTNAMKEFARQANHQIFAVSSTRHQTTHELSKEVHRIGFHFPCVVVDQVQSHYGIKIGRDGKLVTDEDKESLRQLRRKGKDARRNKSIDQVTINTEAKQTITDLFPKIPDKDLFQIIKTAFQKGQNKVGTAEELPLVRRAQLSVVAHVRHMYTPYDRYLKEVGYHEARTLVEKPTLEKLVEWRGDDENGRQVLEDVIREVIVISDDEDIEDDTSDEQLSSQNGPSVEIVPVYSNQEQIEMRPIDYATTAAPAGYDTSYRSEDETPAGYRYVQHLPRRPKLTDKEKADRRGFKRYAVWDEARRRQRAQAVLESAQFPAQSSWSQLSNGDALPSFNTLFSTQEQNRVRGYDHLRNAVSSNGHIRLEEPPLPPRGSPPLTFRGADGVLYERVVQAPSMVQVAPRKAPPTNVIGSYEIARHSNHPLDSSGPRFLDGESVILPSIEDSELSSTKLCPTNYGQNHPSKWGPSLNADAGQLSPQSGRRPVTLATKPKIIDLAETEEHPRAKRPRLENAVAEQPKTGGLRRPIQSATHQDNLHLLPNKLSDEAARGRDFDTYSSLRQRPVPEAVDLPDQPDRPLAPNVHALVPIPRDVHPSRPVEVHRRPAEPGLFASDRASVPNPTYLRSFQSVQSPRPRFVSPPRNSSFSVTRPFEEPRRRDAFEPTVPLELVSDGSGSHVHRAIQTNGNTLYDARLSMVKHETNGRIAPCLDAMGHIQSPRQEYQLQNTHRRRDQETPVTYVREYIPVDQASKIGRRPEGPVNLPSLREGPFHAARQYGPAPSSVAHVSQRQYPVELIGRPSPPPSIRATGRFEELDLRHGQLHTKANVVR